LPTAFACNDPFVWAKQSALLAWRVLIVPGTTKPYSVSLNCRLSTTTETVVPRPLFGFDCGGAEGTLAGDDVDARGSWLEAPSRT
jgi:hypothetical protein